LFGYSPLYSRLIGFAEPVPGLLLFVPRTRLLGVLVLLPVAANITLMGFCFGFPPVKYLALALTLSCLALVTAERAKLQQALCVIVGHAEVGPDHCAHRQDRTHPRQQGRGRGQRSSQDATGQGERARTS
jgi:hypothetical protein